MFRTDIEAMPDNPARECIGVTTGLWRVVYWYQGDGSVIEKYPRKTIHKENLTWEEAEAEESELNRRLNEK